MEEKKMFSTRVDQDLLKRIKHLAIDEDRSLSELVEEALQDLLKKYDQGPGGDKSPP